MKKLITTLLAIALILSMAACSSEEPVKETSNESTEATAVQEESNQEETEELPEENPEESETEKEETKKEQADNQSTPESDTMEPLFLSHCKQKYLSKHLKVTNGFPLPRRTIQIIKSHFCQEISTIIVFNLNSIILQEKKYGLPIQKAMVQLL